LDASQKHWRASLNRALRSPDRTFNFQIELMRSRLLFDGSLSRDQVQALNDKRWQAQRDYGADFLQAAIRLGRPEWLCDSGFTEEQIQSKAGPLAAGHLQEICR
jgi:hypothetical protein